MSEQVYPCEHGAQGKLNLPDPAATSGWWICERCKTRWAVNIGVDGTYYFGEAVYELWATSPKPGTLEYEKFIFQMKQRNKKKGQNNEQT